jgi:hypothetical protein
MFCVSYGLLRQLHLLVIMRKVKWTYLLLMLAGLAGSCRSGDAVAIRDLDPSLRPFLVKAVAAGIVGPNEGRNYINEHATDKELMLLSRSEHPILRAIAFEEMLNRRTFDHFRLVMEHLDDTAMVAIDMGEWGRAFRTVSDHTIHNGKWRTTGDKSRTIDEIVMKHDYLRSAYEGLRYVELQDRYYAHIKKMAERDEDFNLREEALFALAKFRKREDIPLISEALLQNELRIGKRSWQLLTDFPDTAYMEVLQDYYRRRFYKIICRDRDIEKATGYIETIASYRSDSSVRILSSILNRKPMVPCVPDTNYLREKLVRAIWNNPCAAYTDVRRQITAEMRNFLKRDAYDSANTISIENAGIPRDTAAEPVYW